MFAIQFLSLNNLRDFMRTHSLFVLWWPIEKKSQKRRQKITFFNFVLLHTDALFLTFWAFYDFKVVKSIKIEQNLL